MSIKGIYTVLSLRRLMFLWKGSKYWLLGLQTRIDWSLPCRNLAVCHQLCRRRPCYKDQFDNLNCEKPLLNLFLYATLKLLPENPDKVSNKFLVVLSGTGLQVNEAELSMESFVLKLLNRRRYITLGNFLNFFNSIHFSQFIALFL